jgi:ATP-dependent DNA helicase RecG
MPDYQQPATRNQQPLESVKGIGPARAKHLKQLGLNSLEDLLEYFPRDYQQERAEGSIRDLVADQIQTARGTVIAVDYVSGAGRSRFEATIEDETEKLGLVWFNGAYLRRAIHPGLIIRVRGKVRFFRSVPQMVNPKWERLDAPDAEPAGQDVYRPIYPASSQISSETIGGLIASQIEKLAADVSEWFDDDLLARRGLIRRDQAYRLIHTPKSAADVRQARKRLIYDELMLLQLALGMSKRQRDGRLSAPMMRLDRLLDERIRKRFPFEFTEAQQKAVWQIARDLQSGQPMNRLLQGDVGSGKTAVALYGMLVAVANKMQAALLAPTEVLAEQHYLTLTRLLAGSNVRIELFTSRTRKSGRGKLAAALGSGEIHIAIGTQALIQHGVDFANLGLVVIDEQHKLGVRQRAVLRGKGYQPHYLVMTATPIPRTLALSYFADFDLTVIDQLPPGRQPIHTRIISAKESEKAYAFVRQQIREGRQAYVVFPQIEDNGLEDARGVRSEFERLGKGPLKDLRLAMLHGQMSAEEKQQTMLAFRARETDVLVATTVIEVGIDVPNATVIVIDNAERFGLSQLHQLRGRVGRGMHESHCLLLSDAEGEASQARLSAMTKSNDGFEIAELDLQLRGPGEFFGTRQHGLPPLKLADISREIALLQVAREDAMQMLKDDPRLSSARNRALRDELKLRFGGSLQLAQVG